MAVKAGSSVEFANEISEANDISVANMVVAEHEKVEFVVIRACGISGWHPLVFRSIVEKVIKHVQFIL